MPVKPYLWGIAIAVACAFVSLGMVLLYFDPETSGSIGSGLLVATFWILALGILIIGLTVQRVRRGRKPEEAFMISVRHASIMSLLLSGMLILQLSHLLRWWNFLLLIFMGLAVEFYARVKAGEDEDFPTPPSSSI